MPGSEKLLLSGVASKMPFKSRLFKSPRPLLLCAAFFTNPFYLFGIVLESRKLARTGNRLPQNYGLAGNPARQSRSVHAVNKYSEICLNLLRNIFTGKRLIISKIVELVYAHSRGGRC
jgi:hypothetical protein